MPAAALERQQRAGRWVVLQGEPARLYWCWSGSMAVSKRLMDEIFLETTHVDVCRWAAPGRGFDSPRLHQPEHKIGSCKEASDSDAEARSLAAILRQHEERT